MVLYFIQGNREIATARVNESYTRLKSKGFIKEVGMIEYVTGNCLEGKKILSVRIEEKVNGKPLSLTNWRLAMEEVPYTADMKVCADGQGRYVALMLKKRLDNDNTIDDDSIYRQVTVPTEMDVIEFIMLKNIGESWAYKDFKNTNISSGNSFLDRLDDMAKEYDLKNQIVYDFATLGTGNLTCALARKLYGKSKELNPNIKLNDESINRTVNLLNIIKDHPILAKDRISTRFSGGLKKFYKDNELTNPNDVYSVISAITSDVWKELFIAERGTSAEAEKYADGLTKLYERINLQATEPIQPVAPFRIEAAAV